MTLLVTKDYNAYHIIKEKLAVRQGFVWQKPPEVLQDQEPTQQGREDTNILHTKYYLFCLKEGNDI